ncbi:hypothetical protein LOK49_LG09G01488 [Camellia lanceoleosa]|uniref:Uncharacterized protein n=1 Tax=Camellia lanceoleosa TaxID=1840588 RepID=A0ACC0GLA4_9ERIC|nr:hypothetical protein LOK49_LG09G01488 [Camellia lanceoleosa]
MYSMGVVGVPRRMRAMRHAVDFPRATRGVRERKNPGEAATDDACDVVDLVRRVVPLAQTPEDDPRRDELKKLQEKKEEIDMLAYKQVRRILWSGLGLAIMQVDLQAQARAHRILKTHEIV